MSRHPSWEDSRFLRAARRLPVDRPPVWLMRQAGRSLPEYRKVRERHSLVEIVADPELCAEITLQPVRRWGLDAAVLFADIVLPLKAMGASVELVDGVGPVVAEPVRSPADVDRLRVPEEPEVIPEVAAALRLLADQSPVPVIGFAGAPFTLASYLVEGRPSRDFKVVKRFMYREPEAFHRLLEKLADMTGRYLCAQAEAGAAALQLFDSWIGALSVDDYTERVLPHTRRAFAAVAGRGVPLVHFGVGTAGLLERIAASGCDVVSLDWHVRLDEGWARVGDHLAVQGNLDPMVLLGPRELVVERTRSILRQAGGRPGHIFNLGHGVLPDTPLGNLQALVETVREAALVD